MINHTQHSYYYQYWNYYHNLQYYTYHNITSQNPIYSHIYNQTLNPTLNFPQINIKTTQHNNRYNKSNKSIRKNYKKKRLNRRNILPNIIRKIISYIHKILKTPQINNFIKDIKYFNLIKFQEHISYLRQQFSYYISKKNIKNFWGHPSEVSKEISQQQYANYQRVIRILSNWFINNHARPWILLSKKMKKQLKNQHVKYCHKIKLILQSKYK